MQIAPFAIVSALYGKPAVSRHAGHAAGNCCSARIMTTCSTLQERTHLCSSRPLPTARDERSVSHCLKVAPRDAISRSYTLRSERAGADKSPVAKKKPVRIIVRRGASRRFESLKSKTADLPVVVSWDRRSEDRRESGQPASVERRSGDRRKPPPFTWDAADFVVVDDAQEPEATAVPPVTQLDSPAKSTEGDRAQKRRPKKVDSSRIKSSDAKLRQRRG